MFYLNSVKYSCASWSAAVMDEQKLLVTKQKSAEENIWT
jgi:hypothetical protein